MITPDKLINAYVKIRDKIKKDEADFKKHKSAMEKQQSLIEGQLLKILDRQKVKSIRTDFGTAYKDKKEFTGVEDWEEFLGFLVDSCLDCINLENYQDECQDRKQLRKEILDNAKWHFLNKSVSKTAILDHIKENDGEIPAGLKYESTNVVKVRK